MAAAEATFNQSPNRHIRVSLIRDKASPTADQQKDNRSDREITQQIRRSLVKDKSLSTYGHNVKIITQNGLVTLRDPVRSDEEKRTIEAKAAEVAGEHKKIVGKDDWALFVGQWPAAFLLMGVYNKIVKRHGSDAYRQAAA